jgi:hypothetical protein
MANNIAWQECHEWHGLVDAEHVLEPAPLEDRDNDAVGRGLDSRFITAALTGTTVERNTIVSSTTDRPMTAPMNHGSRPVIPVAQVDEQRRLPPDVSGRRRAFERRRYDIVT